MRDPSYISLKWGQVEHVLCPSSLAAGTFRFRLGPSLLVLVRLEIPFDQLTKDFASLQ